MVSRILDTEHWMDEETREIMQTRSITKKQEVEMRRREEER